MFSIGERSGLQADQFNTQTLHLRSHAVVIDAVCGFALSCWKYTSSGEEHMLLQNLYIPFSIHSAFQNMQAAHSVCTNAPHIIRDAGFWTERWWHTERSRSSLALRTRCPWFPTRMSNLDSSDHRTLFHFETVHFKWALAHRTRWHCWTMFI